MTIFGIGIHILIAVFFAIHVVRNVQQLYWLLILFMFPLLGSGEYVRQVLPRMAADVQLYRHASSEYDSAVRWADRLTVEDNLIKA